MESLEHYGTTEKDTDKYSLSHTALYMIHTYLSTIIYLLKKVKYKGYKTSKWKNKTYS